MSDRSNRSHPADDRLRERVVRYAEAIRARRAQWQADLSLTAVGSEEYDAAT